MKNRPLEKRKFSHHVLPLAVIVTLLWGSAFPAIKISYRLLKIQEGELGEKIWFAGMRFFLAGMMVWLVYSIIRKKIVVPARKEYKEIFWLGIVQTTLQYGLFYIGLAYTSGVKSSIIYSMNSFFAVVLAHLFCPGETLNWRKIAGCVTGFLGVIVINLGKGSVLSDFSFKGEGALLLAALALSTGALISNRMTRDNDIFAVTAFQMMFGGSILIFSGFAMGGAVELNSVSGLAWLIYLAFASAVSFCLWTILLKNNEVAKVAIYNFLMPVFGVILSALLLGETVFEGKTIAALLLVCGGIYIALRRN